jgi:hypothetical protein
MARICASYHDMHAHAAQSGTIRRNAACKKHSIHQQDKQPACAYLSPESSESNRFVPTASNSSMKIIAPLLADPGLHFSLATAWNVSLSLIPQTVFVAARSLVTLNHTNVMRVCHTACAFQQQSICTCRCSCENDRCFPISRSTRFWSIYLLQKQVLSSSTLSTCGHVRDVLCCAWHATHV